MSFKDFISSILIVVVLYKKKISECESILSISACLTSDNIDVFVYDNSPEYNLQWDDNYNSLSIHYTQDHLNSGVSKAYNFGAKMASALQKKWLILADQDTIFTRNYFDQVYLCNEIGDTHLFAPYLFSNSTVISPCGFIYNYGFGLKEIPAIGLNNFKGISLLNSAIFIKLSAFNFCGGYNEKVFLDFSDFDFIKKYKKFYGRFYLLDVKLEHNLESAFHDKFNEARFIQYCKSYRAAIHNFFDFFTISFIVFMRVIKLSISFTSVKPINAFWSWYIWGK